MPYIRPYNRLDIPDGKNIAFCRKFLTIDRVRTHWHSYFEIEYFISGEGTYIVNDKEYSIKSGLMTLITPSDFHSIIPQNIKTTPPEIYHVCFKETELPGETVQKLFSTAERTVFFENTEKIEHFFEFMDDDNSEYSDLSQRGLLLVIVSEFLKRSKIISDNIGNSTIQKALWYICRHFTDNLTLTSVAEDLSVSPSLLSKIFPKYTGTTFKQYLIGYRFEHAKKMLNYSDFSITEICYMSGFNSLVAMDRVFKERLGITPLEYRKQFKKQM